MSGVAVTTPAAEKAGGPRQYARPNDQRRTVLALVASALGAFPLCQLFLDTGWLIDVWLSMIVVVGPAVLLRRTRPASAAHIWIGVALLVPWLTLNFVRAHAVFGVLPLRGAWHDVGRLMTNLHHTTTDDVAPVHTTVAIRLALCALLALIAALIDLVAVVGRRGALAGVPLLVIFTIAGAVPRKPVSLVWFVLAAIGFLILLALDSSDDLQRWGHYVPRSARMARRAATAASGQRIAAAAIVAALVLPIFIPADSRNFVANLFHDSKSSGTGFGADAINGNGSGVGGIDPFAALFGQLNRQTAVNLLTIRVSSNDPKFGNKGEQPFYLRTNVLPVFTGDGWRPGSSGDTQSVDNTQFGTSPGTEFQPDILQFNAQITVTGLTSNPPVFASPRAMDGLDSTTEWSPADQLLLGANIKAGQVIQEDVAQPNPTLADLKAATGSDAALQPWLKLPSISDFVRNLTARITAGRTTPYDKARAISNYFANPNNGFTYSLLAPRGDSGDALTDFLKNKIGYCQQYAAAMAVMLRLSGVPSRVVLGYAHDVPDASGTFKVTTFDAHAWDEAYFAGIGWVPFDPTPINGISGGSANDLNWAPHTKFPKSSGKTSSNPDPNLHTVPAKHDQSTAAPVAQAPHSANISPAFIVVLIVLAVAVALLLIPAFVRWRRRRHRIRLARHGDTDALWAELSATATDLGYVWSSARTPRQVATWLGGTSRSADTALATLTTAVEHARYAPQPSTPTSTLVRDLDAIEDGLRSRRSTRERFRATFWPASLDWSRVPLLGRWLPGDGDIRRH
jgi:hypothetical protein